jgi:DNA (cytosine-5)-methyltransferase 1
MYRLRSNDKVRKDRLNHLGLFEGIGGFSLAAFMMGWKTTGWVEINPFCRQVLKKNFPEAIGFDDIKKFNYSIYKSVLRHYNINERTVDIITGGFPCQTFSIAGKGTADLSLWKEMLRCVHEFKPLFAVAENVYGLLARKEGMAIRTVYDDLESEGYTTMPPFIIPACAVGAPHRRDRVWIVAYSSCLRSKGWDTACNRQEKDTEIRPDEFQQVNGPGKKWIASNTNPSGLKEYNTAAFADKPGFVARAFAAAWSSWPTQSPVCIGDDGFSTRLVRTATGAAGNAIVPQVAYELFKAIDLIRRHS